MKTIIIDGIEYNLTPKVLFKKGDFVVIQETTYLISKIEGLNVTLSCNGRDCLFDIDVLKSARLWDITKDAKDGDVLINWNNTTFIFKAIEDETVKFHIAYNENWDAIKTPSNKLSHLGLPEPQFEFHPATKEQRNQLEKAMADAGYTFDFEKKELKKIEPKPWSEEDEKQARQIERIVHNDGCSKKLQEQIANWFKSLKDRVGCEVNCTTTKEWSEEDESMLQNILDCLKNGWRKLPTDIIKYESWLKSLRPQNRWKPSDEQMEALLKLEEMHVLEHKKNQENAHLYMVVKSIREQLLKLKEE